MEKRKKVLEKLIRDGFYHASFSKAKALLRSFPKRSKSDYQIIDPPGGTLLRDSFLAEKLDMPCEEFKVAK